MTTIKKLLSTALLISGALLFAEKTPIAGLEKTQLDNGLTIFTVEDHTVPLVYVEIAVKAGGVTQTPENAGLFHLYEHMMFKGNKLYPDASSVQQALNDMGCTNWNGTTGTSYVNYFVTVPSNQTENALAFWNAAIRSPLMNSKEFEKEKKVVISEIEGGLAEPGTIMGNYIIKNLFPLAPYKLSPGGESSVVKNATIAQMRDIQSKYYIPKNAALFIGGDIKTKEVIKLCEKIWGSWQNNGNEAPGKGSLQDPEPFKSTKYAVIANDQIPPQIAYTYMAFRGADADYDIEDTYTLDYLLHIFNDPDGSFKNEIVSQKEFQIPDTNKVSASYGTSRTDGVISFEATMMNPSENIAGRVKKLQDLIQNRLTEEVVNNPENFSDEKRTDIARRLSDSDIWSRQTAKGLLTSLRFWWAVTGDDYYYNYNDKLSSVTMDDAVKAEEKYIKNKSPLVVLMVNPQILEKNSENFAKEGFEVINSNNAFWWQNEKFKPDPKKIAEENGTIQEEEIYKPVAKALKKAKAATKLKVKKAKLKNGIPVYIKNTDNREVDNITIVVRGGTNRLTEDTSGLEDCLFTMMSSASKKYSWADRKTRAFDTSYSIYSSSSREGSSLTLSTLDKYLDDTLDILVDGFLNPTYEEAAYSNMMTGLSQSIQEMENDPQSILAMKSFKEIYKNHPYIVRPEVTPESFKNITVENMKKLHDEILDSKEIFIVATGKINKNKLIKELNKSLGQIKSVEKNKASNKEINPVQVEGDPVIMTHPAARGTGYVYRFFTSPSPLAPDYIPAKLAADIYSTVLFNVVRIHYGVCYTPGSYTLSSFAPIGAEYLFKMSAPENFSKAMEEARNLMAEGKIVVSTNEDSSYKFESLEENLQSYKNTFINSSYSSYATSGGLSSMIVNNLLKYNDIDFTSKLLKKIEDTKAEEILDAFNKYWVQQKGQWWIMTGPEMKDKIKL